MTIPVGLQLFAVRGECDRDLERALASVAECGYQGAEPWNYDGSALGWQGRSGPELRRLFDANGLACCGFHISPPCPCGAPARMKMASGCRSKQ